MRKLAILFLAGLAAVTAANATLVVLIPARGATAVCTDRRFVGSGGNRFDADDKLQLLPPNAVVFVVGLEAVSAGDQVVYAPGAIFRRFLAERARQGIPADLAIRDSAGIAQYLRDPFERILRSSESPVPKQPSLEIDPTFTLGILRTDHHSPQLTTITVSRDPKKGTAVTSRISHSMERFGVDSQWRGSIFSRSDPMYAGQTEVVRGLIDRNRQFSRFTADPYVKKFLLADFGMPLTDPDDALKAARRLIAVTADGLNTIPDIVRGVSEESVCAVLDYSSETAQYR